ncbi:MAG TPA: carbohydrate ABC transporter permease, partial [Chloroflexota bacterium]|nr:carbohydrate ABC transporter permease [Chloroflexota bacterium]
ARASFAVQWPHFTAANFTSIFTANVVQRPLVNSLELALGTTVLAVVTGVAAAYALSRHRSWFTRGYLFIVLFATGLPVQLLMIPAYTLFIQLNLLDSIPATILFLTATSLPFAIWLLKNFIDQIPIELDEASQVDGAGAPARLRLIILPLAAPGIAVAAMFTFLNAWGQFVIPYILLQSPDKLPASVTIYGFLSAQGRVQYGALAAFTLVFSLPVLLLYGILARFLSGAFNFGSGVKG